MRTKNLKAVKGDDITIRAVVKRPSDADENIYEVVDLTDADVWFTAKYDAEDLDADAVLRLGTGSTGLTGVTVTDPTNGVVVVDIDESETENLGEGTVVLVWDMQVREDTGQLTTVAGGRFFFMDQVTISS